MIVLLLLEWYSAMVAYTIKMGQIASELLKPFVNINPILLSILISLIGSYLVFKGLLIIEKSEFWIVSLTIIIVAIIGIIALPNIKVSNIAGFSLKDLWLPFGVVLFAFGGAGAMPEMREELKNKTNLMKKAIILGTMISLVLYILFPLFIAGVTGPDTTEEGVLGLGHLFGYKMLLLGGLFGILTMFTSFLAIGLALKEIFKYDCYKSNMISSLSAVVIPILTALAIMLLKVDNAFYNVISLSGSILFPLTGMMFILIYWKSKKKGDRQPEYSLKYSKILGIAILTIFFIGLINELVRIFS